MKRAAWMLILFPLLAAFPAQAEPAATPAMAPDRFANTQIHRDGSTALPVVPPAASSGSTGGSGELDLMRVTVSLATVIGLIFGLRWVSRRVFSAAARTSNPSAVRMLARCPIAPRQSILLLQVGRRILVVGDTGSNLTSLGQITDADEIAALIVQSKPAISRRNSFASLFGLAQERITPTIPRMNPPP